MRRGKGAPKPATADATTTDETKTPEGGGAPAPTTATDAATSAVHPYENSIKHVCTVRTVEEFWSTG